MYFHQLGTAQKADKIIFGESQKRRYVGGKVTEDDRYLIITAANSTYGNELYVKDLSNSDSSMKTIVANYENDYSVLENVGSKLLVVTDKNAPNKRIVLIDVDNPEPENWKDVISETNQVLEPSTCSGFIFAHYMKDAVSLVKQYDYAGKLIREM